ncbi:MAG: hypothetical protein ACRDP6_48860 [Actinoallomurus sp.]
MSAATQTTASERDYQRAYAAARQRALARLAANHRGEYAALLAEERAKEASA